MSDDDGPNDAVPKIVTTPPGPKTRAILERQSAVLYRGLADEVGPFVICRKSGYEIEDVDGNVYLDFISAMASSSIRDPCSMDRTPARTARLIPSAPWAWAAT